MASGGSGFNLFFIFLITLLPWAVRIFIAYLLIKCLIKYLNEKKVTPEQEIVRRSLGEVLRERRQTAGLTQEWVAEQLGVSRQAVNKWETGSAEPSTSNLLALAKLYGVDPGELLKGVEP